MTTVLLVIRTSMKRGGRITVEHARSFQRKIVGITTRITRIAQQVDTTNFLTAWSGVPGNSSAVISTQVRELHSGKFDAHFLHVTKLSALFAAALLTVVSMKDDDSSKQQHEVTEFNAQEVFSAKIALPKTLCEASSTKNLEKLLPVKSQRKDTPRNVMLFRKRSLRGQCLEEKYVIDWGNVLGEGAYGTVHPARLKATGEKVALKKISRRFTNSTGFQTETDALLRIYENGGHPNISGLRDMYDDHNFFYLIMDLVAGGEMFEHLINYGAYSEADAARLMHEVASALAFMHGVGVIHADLKPENLLLSTKNRLDGTIKIIDFGSAVVIDDNTLQSEWVENGLSVVKNLTKGAADTGTTAYWSPERFEGSKRPADATMDMWALGVVLYIMLTGVHPFDLNGTATDDEIEQVIKKDPRPPMDNAIVGHLSESAKDLILKLMEKDPEKRLTAYQMLHHPWVRGETATTEKMADSAKKLSRFQELRNQLEAGMFAVLISSSHNHSNGNDKRLYEEESDRKDSSVHLLQRAFSVFDAEGKGYVTPDDLVLVASERTGSTISSQDTKDFLATEGGGLTGDAALSLSQFSKLFSALQQRHFPRGHYIFHAGDQGDAMYFLCSGKVEIQTKKGQLIAILRNGDFFGEGSLLEASKRRSASAKCATPVDAIEIKREDFERYLHTSSKTRTDLKMTWKARSLDHAKSLLRLQTNLKTRTLENGDYVYKEGDLGTSMFRVSDVDGGELEVSHDGNVVHKYIAGDSFGESSLLFNRPRSSTVKCVSNGCRLYEMTAEDFLAVVNSTPRLSSTMKDICRNRLFKRAVKKYALTKTRGMTDEDLVAAFHDADLDHSGELSLQELTRLMRKMDPEFPEDEIRAMLEFVDVNEDGKISLPEFKRIFHEFDKSDNDSKRSASQNVSYE